MRDLMHVVAQCSLCQSITGHVIHKQTLWSEYESPLGVGCVSRGKGSGEG